MITFQSFIVIVSDVFGATNVICYLWDGAFFKEKSNWTVGEFDTNKLSIVLFFYLSHICTRLFTRLLHAFMDVY